ncbi:MAG: alpha/beta fold hydrolase [Proteobacteria bacterium]|nr:alpha/beta fold hydrolase [Pseudomonadota bacterium]
MPKFLNLLHEDHPHGNPDAQVVVLLPGVGCGVRFWDNLLPTLKPDYRVVVFANPGVDGCPDAKVFTVNDLALGVLSKLEELGISRAHVIGHSMGGYIAQRLAGLRPDMVDRLVLISTSFGGRATDADIRHVLAHMLPIWPAQSKLLKTNPHEAFKFAVGRNTPTRNPQGYAAFVESRTNPRVPEKVYAAHFFCAIKFSSLAYVANIRQQTLVIHGNDDNIINVDGGRELAQRLPNARFLEKESGHIATYEVPDIYPDILAFLQGAAVGEKLAPLPPLSAAELAEDMEWRRKRIGSLSMTALFALSKGLPSGVKHLLSVFKSA